MREIFKEANRAFIAAMALLGMFVLSAYLMSTGHWIAGLGALTAAMYALSVALTWALH